MPVLRTPLQMPAALDSDRRRLARQERVLAVVALVIALPSLAVAGTPPLVVTGNTVIDTSLGTIDGSATPAFEGNGVFRFSSIDIQATGTLSFTGSVAARLRSDGPIIVNGQVVLTGPAGLGSGNGMPGAAPVSGVAGGGQGGAGGCRADFPHFLGQHGGGSTGGGGGTTLFPGAAFNDTTGGGGGGNGTAGGNSAPPFSGTAAPGAGAPAYGATLLNPLVGGGGGGGGGCDVDDPAPTPPGGNDGGASGGAGGGALRLEAATTLVVGATGTIGANGGNGGTSTGNGGSAGGGAGGTIELVAQQITHDGSFSALGGLGGLEGQPGATSVGGPGGVGTIVLRDADGVIAGGGASTPAFTATTLLGSDPLRLGILTLQAASLGNPYSALSIGLGGTLPYTYALTGGALPVGLLLNTSTGAITGTSSSAAGTVSSFTITLTDGAAATYSRNFTIRTNDSNLALTTQVLPSMMLGLGYSAFLQTTGGVAPLTFLLQGALPTGLSLNTATGEVSGTAPAAAESRQFNVVVRDSTVNNSQYDTLSYILSDSQVVPVELLSFVVE